MFVDIGTLKDGLVHIKDMSKDYFTKNHASKYLPGMDIPVWIKFIDTSDPDVPKFGLQLYPLSDQALDRSKRDISKLSSPIESLKEADPISGTVVKVCLSLQK